jgi:hypothetical protein
MLSSIKRFFGIGTAAPQSSSSPSSTGSPEDRRAAIAASGPLTHDAAVSELAIVRAQLAAVHLQLARVIDTVVDLSKQEASLLLQREQVLMECHDGYLHPQLDGIAGPSTVDDPSLLLPSSSDDDDEDEGHAPSAEETESRRVAKSRRIAQELGVVPVPSTRPQTESTIRETNATLLAHRERLGAAFDKVVTSLRTRRNALDDTVFRLELQVIQLEADETSLGRAVGELERTEWKAEAVLTQDADRRRRAALEQRRRQVLRQGDGEECAVAITSPLRRPDTGALRVAAATMHDEEMSDREGEPPVAAVALTESLTDTSSGEDDGEYESNAAAADVARLRRLGTVANLHLR